MKEGRCFRYKKRGHIAYDCFRKEIIAAILKGICKDSHSQGKKSICFIIIYTRKPILQGPFYYLIYNRE